MCIAAPAFSNVGDYRAIFFDGPEPDRDPAKRDEETPIWTVYVGDEHADPVGRVYHVHNFKSAEGLAKRMAEDRRLDLIHEASPA